MHQVSLPLERVEERLILDVREIIDKVENWLLERDCGQGLEREGVEGVDHVGVAERVPGAARELDVRRVDEADELFAVAAAEK